MIKTTPLMLLIVLGLAVSTATAQDEATGADPLQLGKSLLEEARALENEGKYAEALEKTEAAVASFQKAVDAEQQLGWHDNNGILEMARVAVRNLLAYQQAVDLAEDVIALNEGDYWERNARMNLAETYRAWGKYDEARRQYKMLLEMSDENRPMVLLARGRMLYYELGEKEQGRKEIVEAVQQKELHHMQRIRGLTELAEAKRQAREYTAALRLLRLLTELPHLNEEHQAEVAAEAYYKMGEIYHTRGDVRKAKEFYRRAMNHEGGEMRYRVMARDALEDIRYFE